MVPVVSLWSRWGVTAVSQWGYSGVTVGLQRCTEGYSGVQRVTVLNSGDTVLNSGDTVLNSGIQWGCSAEVVPGPVPRAPSTPRTCPPYHHYPGYLHHYPGYLHVEIMPGTTRSDTTARREMSVFEKYTPMGA